MSDINQNVDGTYTLTLSQIEGLSNGKIKLINGRLYLDASQIMKEPSAFNSKQGFTNESLHPDFNRPTQAQIERCKQFPQVHPETKVEDLVPRPVDTDHAVENPTYLTPTIFHKNSLSKLLDRLHSSQREISREQYTLAAFGIYSEYVKEVDHQQYKGNNWEIGLRLQNKYWDIFRGYSMEVIRLSVVNKIRNTKPFELIAPIEGMKKR